MTSTTPQTRETDWRLRPIVGLLSLSAGICVVAAARYLKPIQPSAWPTLFTIVLLLGLVLFEDRDLA